jgi:hypothetical protein
MESPYKGKTGLRRLLNAFGYSMAGIKAAYKNEDAFRQEVLMAIVLIPLAIYLGETGLEKAIMIASVLLVNCSILPLKPRLIASRWKTTTLPSALKTLAVLQCSSA